MGWDNPVQAEPVEVSDSALRPVAVADKKGVTAWRVDCPGLPQRSEQHRVVRELKRRSRDQLVVFVAPDTHLWLWPEQRSSGVGYRLVDYEYPAQAPTEALLQRLKQASFKIEEENQLTSSSVLDRVRRSFNADKVTKSFYREFQKHHKDFSRMVEGIPVDKSRRWYVSVLLNRLMFMYFIQQKGFLNGDQNYLRKCLGRVRERYGADQFYAFYREFLLPLCHEGLGRPSGQRNIDPVIEQIIGNVPYVNGGIFEQHTLEIKHDIQIRDDAFETLFDFFDSWRWHLDENRTGAANEINPDILGFIFEKYINFTDRGQRETGAYYTKPDVTGYMATFTILPALADRFVSAGLDDPCLLLSGSDDDYIHDSVLHGVEPISAGGGKADQPPPSDELALPGERWCDITHRRERCARLRSLLSDGSREWTIDDCITENLDIRELLADYLVQLSSAEECDQAFKVLRSLTVCDPTVGSGAFLFAALEVLEPLYEVVLSRAAELHDRQGDTELADCLRESRRHPNPSYWMLKTLCLNNLYGIDLMDEAPEISKLRLFLKLAAQLDDVNQLEPLPDLDFNIKSGNLLVGIADRQDAERRLGAGQLDLGGEIKQIGELAERVGIIYDDFVRAQSKDIGNSDHAVAKQRLNAELMTARHSADDLLYRKRHERGDFEYWRDSHRPFHWFVEFPSVWRHDGFDIVIGNPPYIQTNKVREYRRIGYKTQNCPDLYAVCVERASNLVNERGRASMIVMHNLCFSHQYTRLRNHLSSLFSSLHVSSYDRLPSGLFSDSAAVRSSIFLATKYQHMANLAVDIAQDERRCAVVVPYVSSVHRWHTNSRSWLFDSVTYVGPQRSLVTLNGNDVWPFVGSEAISGALGNVALGKPISDVTSRNGRYSLAYKKTGLYMLGISVEPPPTLGGTTANYGYLRFSESICRDLALLMLAGRWGYVWWLIYSDWFHVTSGVVKSFPGDIARIVVEAEHEASDLRLGALQSLAHGLAEEMTDHLAWTWKLGLKVGRYKMHELRHITDEADLLLAQAWGIEDAYEAAGNFRDRMIFGTKE